MIPEEIDNLSNLERLYLDNNQLSGEIPETIGNLFNLERLYLHENNLSGDVPLSLLQLAPNSGGSLESLQAYDNDLNWDVNGENIADQLENQGVDQVWV